jgi:acetolactate synthase I/II/III large subunit
MMDSNVGDLIAGFLAECGVDVAFGVISIHNMPILDAIHRRNRIRFVPARGEAGACAMADAAARISGGLGVCITSTGTGAGNAAGAMVEAQTAGTPVLHLTGQIDTPYLDRGFGYVHEAADQLGMLKAISKAAFRIASPGEALSVLREAVRIALTAPTGPVSIEIPIDVQKAALALPADLAPVPVAVLVPDAAALDRLAARLTKTRRPLLWLGGGAKDAGAAVARLADMGIGVVTSASGRAILREDHPLSLGVFGASPAIEELYKSVDFMLVAGSHLRSNETRTYALRLPAARARIDVDAAAEQRGYESEFFVRGDAALALAGLADRLQGRLAIDPAFAADVASARRAAEAGLRRSLGPYTALLDAVERQMPPDALWVRDITMSNTIWGNRLPRLKAPRMAAHAMGGGIGLGLPMAVGAAAASGGRKTVALIGDGGIALNLGELATALDARSDLVILLMNDGGYGIIRNIQDLDYGARRCFADITAPQFGLMAESLGIPHRLVSDLAAFPAAFTASLGTLGCSIIEIDMRAVGPFATKFGGPAPPQKA